MKDKKIKSIKSLEERQAIVANIKEQIAELGIDVDLFEPLVTLKQAMLAYQGDDIISGFSGKFFVPEFNRYVEYVLPLRKNTDGYVKLVAK